MNKSSSFILFSFLIFFTALTTAQETIQPQILPVDSDGDGVIDEHDECYKTSPGAKVDKRGCYVSLTEVKEINININFDVDAAVVKPEYFTSIKEVATFMQQYPLTHVIIEGHTDSDASNAYNKYLSERRAKAVAKVLINRYNIAAMRVAAVGFGEEKPLVANDSPENKSKNRRVVAFIRSVDKEPYSPCDCDESKKN